jgi:hypothetical protein
MENTVTFDLPATGISSDDGEWVVYPNSLLMEAGDYTQDKGIRLDPEDILREEDEFSGPVPNLFHHAETFGLKHDLKGLLGSTLDVWTKDGGKTFHGTVVIPKPLDDLWSRSGKPKSISTEWDPKTKRFKGVSLCVSEPYIPTAALMSTFAAMREKTYEGASAIQQLHDQAARSGAVCSAANSRKPGEALFHSAEELTAIQAVHDAAVKGGAKCSLLPPKDSSAGLPRPYFAGTGTWKVGAARDLPLLDDNDAGWDGPAAERSIWGDSDTVPADAKRAFLVYDASEPDLKGSYKLPFAVRKDGKLHASRAGLRIAATRIPKTDADPKALQRARAVVDGYQARFAKIDGAQTRGGKGKETAAAMAADVPDTADFAARIRHESATAFWQDMHDASSALDPMVCDPKAKAARPDRVKNQEAEAGFADHPKQLKDIKKAHDLAVEHGATCPGKTATMSDSPNAGVVPARQTTIPLRRARKMDWDERFATFMGLDPDKLPWRSPKKSKAMLSMAMADDDGDFQITDEPPAEAETPTPPATPTTEELTAAFAETPQYKTMQAELERLKQRDAENAEREKARTEKDLSDRAATFAADLCRDKVDAANRVITKAQLTPAAFSLCEALYKQMARDDAAAQAVVTFTSDGQERQASRIDTLIAFCKALPGHSLLGQQLSPNGRLDPTQHTALFYEDTGDAAEAQRKKDLAERIKARNAARQPQGSTNGHA